MIDLHCHSICSDGTDSPKVLAKMADEMGLKALALTDHDTLMGLDAFLDQQRSVSVRLIPGIELSCEFLGQDMHVLGLFINHRDPVFKKRVESLRKRRIKRNVQIFQKLAQLNINICPEEYFDGEPSEVLTRSHIAKMLTDTGYAATKSEVFQKYLGEDGLAYAPFEYLSPEEAFRWIREANGLPVIAHPARFGRFARSQFRWERAMADLHDQGAIGIEAYYSEHSETETAYFLNLCKTLDMAPTGGSDYHGSNKPSCKMGTGWGNLNVPDLLLNLLEKLSVR